METLPSLASLSGLTLLISVLIGLIKIFDESHKAFFSEMKNQLEGDFKFPTVVTRHGTFSISVQEVIDRTYPVLL